MMERPPAVLDYAAFQHPPTRLFRDYLAGAPGSRPFYDGARWDLEALIASADRTLGLARARGPLAQALVRQQESRGASLAAQRAGQLEGSTTVAIVTGQQPGLFGGPLFVLYKALAALELARVLEERRREPVVPIFWVAADDHDFAEIRSATVLDESGQLRTLRYAPTHEPIGQPASQILLDETIRELIDEMRRVLPEGPHREWVLQRTSESYRTGISLSEAFCRLLSQVLPGLVVMDASDAALKALVRPVLSRELLEVSPTSRLAEKVGPELLRAGYHQQVPLRAGFLNLFVMMQSERRALAAADGQVEVRGLGVRLPVTEAARLLEARPADWSPGVLLRPLTQDQLLPTAAYLGGPAEIAYHAQIGPSYAHFGIPRPALVPRPSVTLVEPAQARALEAERLTLYDLQADPQALLSEWAKEAHPQVEAAFQSTRQSLGREMASVQEVLGALDPTLRAASDAALGRALHQIEALHEKATRALKKRDQTRAERLRRTRDALLPGGSFQERGLSFVSVLARHGEAVLELVRSRMDLWAKGHQMVYL